MVISHSHAQNAPQAETKLGNHTAGALGNFEEAGLPPRKGKSACPLLPKATLDSQLIPLKISLHQFIADFGE